MTTESIDYDTARGDTLDGTCLVCGSPCRWRVCMSCVRLEAAATSMFDSPASPVEAAPAELETVSPPSRTSEPSLPN